MRPVLHYLAIAAAAWALPGPAAMAGTPTIPAPPARYVLDQDETLGRARRQTLESVLIEHDKLTGEQLYVSILADCGPEGERLFRQLLVKWKVGRPGRGTGALLGVCRNDEKSAIELGHGLEAVVPDERISNVRKTLNRRLGRGLDADAIGLAALEVLELLGSPLAENGKAAQSLEAGGLSRTWPHEEDESSEAGHGTWWLALLLGVIAVVPALYIITGAEALYRADGWHRFYPWQTWSRRRPRTTAENDVGGTHGAW